MDEKKLNNKKLLRWLVLGLPLGTVLGAAFLPLQPVVMQGLILVVLVWFQMSLLLGIFS